MRWRVIAFTTVVTMSSMGFGESPAIGYEERIAMVRSLGQRYPGYVRAKFDEFQSLGLWGGIAIQTEWQAATNRDGLAIWSTINESLTVLPFQLAVDFEAGVPCANKACEAWYDYFLIAANPPAPIALYWLDPAWIMAQKALWVAHTATVRWALETNEAALTAGLATAPKDEGRFWSGWVRTVPVLDALNQPTFGHVIAKMSRKSFPDCGPLQSNGTCKALRLSPRNRAAFTALMIANGRLGTAPSLAALLPFLESL